MKIAIASDHLGLEMKEEMKEYLSVLGYETEDLGSHAKERVDYCDYGFIAGEAVASGKFEKAILICGTGVGISISANKVKGIRAVVCSEPYSAALSKQHNNTNILAFGARVIGIELAKMIVHSWLNAEFEGGRHLTRVNKIIEYENRK